MTYNRGRDNRAWRRLTRQRRNEVAQYGLPCYLCGKPIDLTLPRRHRYAFSVDHIIALHDGGPEVDRENAAPCHVSCNSIKAAKAARSRKKQLAQQNVAEECTADDATDIT
jgi:hypothetical protein